MDAQQIAIAERCLGAAYAGTMSFPRTSQPRCSAPASRATSSTTAATPRPTTWPAGTVSRSRAILRESTVAADFDPAGVAALIRWAQSGSADYSYAGFSRQAKARGCAGYVVSFPGRRVLYFGRDAQTHVEHFPCQPVRPAQAGSSS